MKGWQWAVILAILILAVSGISVAIYLYGQTSPTPTVHTIAIVNGQDTVNAGTYFDHPFTIPSGNVSSINVSGTFTAQGGSGNDIKIYVIDSANFGNYTSKSNFNALYSSGQIHNASINVNLTLSGDYHLVLDNMFSASSTKTVNIQVNATYTLN